jgi:ABC-type molybdate transport system substrate-binding protein
MSVEPSSMTLNQQLAAGSVFLMAMIAVAALSNKGKAESKSVEFDVEDLEMTNKKESKKQIKKTLKDIMKSNNTKVSIMNN